MKLMLAIVQDQDASAVVDALVEREFRVTRINTHGGFLRRGNATLLIGADDEQVDAALDIIRENSEARSSEGDGVPVGAGTAFVLPIRAFTRV